MLGNLAPLIWFYYNLELCFFYFLIFLLKIVFCNNILFVWCLFYVKKRVIVVLIFKYNDVIYSSISDKCEISYVF